MNILKKVNSNYLVAISTMMLAIIIYIACLGLTINNRADIPNGFLVGAGIASIFYALLGLSENYALRLHRNAITIALIGMRLATFIGVFVLVSYVFFKLGVKAINPFSTCGGYLLSLISIITITLIRKKEQ